MLKVKGKLPEFLWAELVNTAAYIRNRCPTKLNGDVTPEELWSLKKPNVSYFREIGTRSYVLNKRGNIGKFAPKSEEYILVGYSEESKAYRLWKPGTRHIIRSRDIVFLEERTCKNEEAEKENYFEFKIKNNFHENKEKEESTIDEDANDHDEKINNKRKNENIEDTEMSKTKKEEPKRITRSATNQMGSVNLAIANDPKSIEEMEESDDSKQWIEAMKIEYEFLMKNNTWELVNRPSNKNVIGSKWVFKTKYNQDGSIDRRKARLVAKGYSQIYGIDYLETYAPVANISSIRLILATAVEKELSLHQLDVSTAFLNGDLEEEIFMEQPTGFIDEENKHKICKVKKAIYGLKQSGRQWNTKLDLK